MIARAMFSGVSGMGRGILYFTGRPRLRGPVPRSLSMGLTAYDCCPSTRSLTTKLADPGFPRCQRAPGRTSGAGRGERDQLYAVRVDAAPASEVVPGQRGAGANAATHAAVSRAPEDSPLPLTKLL